MSEDEFRKRLEADRNALQGAQAFAAPPGTMNGPASSTAITVPANGMRQEKPIDRLVRIAVEQESITGLAEQWVDGGCGHHWRFGDYGKKCPKCYGEQCADTDGMARYMVSDGHEEPRKQSLVTLTAEEAALAAYNNPSNAPFVVTTADDLKARIARKEAANEALTQRVFALEAKLEATLADAQSLQRKAADWEAECRRLSALLVETREELARRMALPARALRYGR